MHRSLTRAPGTTPRAALGYPLRIGPLCIALNNPDVCVFALDPAADEPARLRAAALGWWSAIRRWNSAP